MNVSVPLVARQVIRTASRWFAVGVGGRVLRIGEAEIAVVEGVGRVFKPWMVLLVPAGASLIGVTLTVIVLATGSRSTPPLAVTPSSCTWKVKRAFGVARWRCWIGRRREPQAAGVDVATEMNWPAVTATSLLVSVPLVGSVVIFTANRLLAGPWLAGPCVARIGEAEVGRREDVGAVFQQRVVERRVHSMRRADGRVVDDVHVEREVVRRLIQDHAAASRTAGVFDLEGHRRIGSAVLVGGRGEPQPAGRNVAGQDEVARVDRDFRCPVEAEQRAVGGQRGDQHAIQRVRIGRISTRRILIVRIGEAEVAGGERVLAVLVDRDACRPCRPAHR